MMGTGASDVRRVHLVGDWDADGVVSAAEVYYAQHSAMRFPYPGKAYIKMAPSGPRGLSKRLEEGCDDYLVLLDIPYTREVAEALYRYRQSCGKANIIYFDHHSTTINSAKEIEERFRVLVYTGNEPTSALVREILERAGVRLHPRLNNYVEAVRVLEGGGKRQTRLPSKFIDIAATISKNLNRARDESLWVAYVKWIASPLPFDDITLPIRPDEDFVTATIKASEEADKEIRDAAMELAMAAEQVGMTMFVDARRRWRRPGATALASQIHKILKAPVAVLIERDDKARILIIRSSRGEAGRLVDELSRLGAVDDTGGHENVATARLSEEVTLQGLKDLLRRASINLIVGRGGEKG